MAVALVERAPQLTHQGVHLAPMEGLAALSLAQSDTQRAPDVPLVAFASEQKALKGEVSADGAGAA
jgi:hypothetical protein